uniref:AP180 N-terminal homology (ANTH) domain-containing protein n=1 Tax=Denticeps clupeoides TaxID=299321 RepID=A0AAY4CYD7_9TELE
MRTMSVEKLLKTLPIVQSQLDALLDFEVTPSDLTSGVVHDAFMLLFRDSVRLFAAYNEGVINLLEKYFDMKKSQCTEALEIYTQFLSRMTRLSEFLKVSEAPSTLSEALQHHLVSLEKRRAKESSSCSSSNLSCTEETQRGADAEKDKIVLMKDQHLRDSSIQTPAVSPVGHSVGSSSSSSSTSDQMPTLSNTNGIMSSFTNGHFEQLSLGLSAPPTNHQPNSSAWGGSFLKPPPLTGQVPNTGIHVSLHTGAKLLGGDLDSSLASLVGNLHFGGAPAKKQDLPFEKKPVGGSGCTPSWQSKHTAALWGHTPSAPAPSSAPHMNGIIYTGYAPAPVALPMMAPQVPVYSMVPPQMGQMSSVPVMAPPPVIYNQPILRTTHPFGPVPGAQVSRPLVPLDQFEPFTTLTLVLLPPDALHVAPRTSGTSRCCQNQDTNHPEQKKKKKREDVNVVGGTVLVRALVLPRPPHAGGASAQLLQSEQRSGQVALRRWNRECTVSCEVSGTVLSPLCNRAQCSRCLCRAMSSPVDPRSAQPYV